MSQATTLWRGSWAGRCSTVLALACMLAVPSPLRAGGGDLTAQYIGVQTVVDGTLSSPQGVAVDGSGTVYVANTGASDVVIETLSAGTYTQSTVGSGLSSPGGVAVDGSGNLYIIDTGNNRLLKETLSGGAYTQTTIASGFNAPAAVAVDASGNVYVADTGNNQVVKETISGGGYTQSTVASGFSGPQGVAVDVSGNVYVSDTGNGQVLKETLSGGSYTQSAVTTDLLAPRELAVGLGGNLYVADSQYDLLFVEAPSSGSYVESFIEDGLLNPSGVAADAGGSIYIGDTGNDRVLKIQQANFGSLNLRSPSSVMSLLFRFEGGFATGTISAPVVLTQGVSGLDFVDAGTGSCTTNGTSHVYSPNDTCTVDVTFTPQYPGVRYGAVVLRGSWTAGLQSGSLTATGYAYGIGLGPQATFVPGTQSTIASGFVAPYGIAVDPTGSVFVTDEGAGILYKETLSGGAYTQSTISTTLDVPGGVAVDGAGNLYVAEVGGGDVRKETLSNGSYTETTIVSGLVNLDGIAIDGAGNLYITSFDFALVYKEMLQPDGSYVQSELGSLLNGPTGVAVDGSGNLYISNDDGGSVYKDTLQADGSYLQSTVASGLSFPESVVVDNNGNLYIGATGSKTVYKEALQGDGSYVQSTIATGLNDLWWIAVDQTGNLYLSQRTSPGVESIINVTAPPVLTFASTNAGSVSSDSPQTVTLANIGNTALLFPIPSSGDNPSVSLNFTLNSSGETACPLVASGGATGSLAANSACTLAISFAPTQAGTITGSLVLTDTDLNAAGPGYATQTVSLNGVGVLTSTATALAASPNPAFAGQSVTLTATVSPAPIGSPLGTVSFYDGATLLNTANVNSSGLATFSTTSLATGAHSLTAVYSGNSGFATSTSSVFTETINALTATTTALVAAPNPAVVGQSVTLTATVSPAPTGSSLGTVSFYDGATLLGSGNVNSSGVATLSTANLPQGADSLTAVYSGNAAFATSTSSALSETVTSALTSTTTTLTATPNPASADQAVTLTATITPAPTGASAGTVSFFDGSTPLGTENVNSTGIATLTSSSLPAGALSLTAVYSGNAGFAGSTSSVFSETVSTTYTVTAPSTPVTAQEGGSAKIDVSVPPVGGPFDNLVTMSASGLPPKATATFNPPTVTPGSGGAPTVLTIQLAALAAGGFDPNRRLPYRLLPLASFALAMGLCGAGFRGKRVTAKGRRGLALSLVFVSIFTWVGCGGGFLGPPTTPPGSYVVTITGTSGSLQASATVTVVVQ